MRQFLTCGSVRGVPGNGLSLPRSEREFLEIAEGKGRHLRVIPKQDLNLYKKIFYNPEEVLAIFEIKSFGSFGEKIINKVNNIFRIISGVNNNIECIYLTLTERKSYKWAITKQNIGFPAYTLFWQLRSGKKELWESSNDWVELLQYLKKVVV